LRSSVWCSNLILEPGNYDRENYPRRFLEFMSVSALGI
jgi:hypothetical protein